MSLAIKDKAPDFSVCNQNGQLVSLKNFAGKKLVIFFYPNDNTPTCTIEACNIRDNYEQLQKEGYTVVGVSNNTEKQHVNFIKKYNFPFDLLADVDKTMVEAYGVYGLKKFMGREFMGIIRTTFVINEKGIITDIISKVEAKNHTQQILS